MLVAAGLDTGAEEKQTQKPYGTNKQTAALCKALQHRNLREGGWEQLMLLCWGVVVEFSEGNDKILSQFSCVSCLEAPGPLLFGLLRGLVAPSVVRMLALLSGENCLLLSKLSPIRKPIAIGCTLSTAEGPAKLLRIPTSLCGKLPVYCSQFI